MTSRHPVRERVLNLPNVITVARLLLLVPVCWLLLAPTPAGVGWAVAPMVLLGVWAGTDWADGFLARRLDQVSRLGTVLDPIADRVGIAVVIMTLALIGLLPWWLLAVIVGVDVVTVVVAGRAAGRGSIPVSNLGKVRTALLLVAIVGLVVGAGLQTLDTAGASAVVQGSRWVAMVGMVVHVVAGADYLRRWRRHRLQQSGQSGA